MSLTKVSYSIINGSPVNVLDFGAVGDGVTDSTSAIQAALNSNPDGVVVLPAGTYLISATILQKNRQRVIGENAILKAITDDINMWAVEGGAAYAKGSLENITFLGENKAAIAVTQGGATEAEKCVGFVMIGVECQNFKEAGIRTYNNCWLNSYYNVFCSLNPIGFHHTGGDNAGENVSFYNCNFYTNDVGLKAENPGAGGQSLFLYGCSFDYNTDWSIVNATSIVDGANMELHGCHIESEQKYIRNAGNLTVAGGFFTNGVNSGVSGYLCENYGTMAVYGGRWTNAGSGKQINNYGSLSYISVIGLESNTNVVNQSGANSFPVIQLGNAIGQYTFVSNYWNCNQLNLSGQQMLYGNAAPTTGTWTQGDVVYNHAPTAAGYLGWVCVTGGSPGTWKTFGQISA